MAWKPIRKGPQAGGFNLTDYDTAVREFSWDRARAQLDGLPGGRGLNIAHEAVDRHAARRIDEDDYPKLATLASGAAFLAGP
jgi:acetyl-CoA synthetase